MKPTELQSVDELYAHLNVWKINSGKAIQLDGSSTPKSNPAAVYVVWIGHEKSWFKIPGDCKKEAIGRFLKLFEKGRRDQSLLKKQDGCKGLILATDTEPNGWYCYSVKKEGSLKVLKKAA